ncbi:cytochrome-c oxidase, cbb3-type subunit III [Rubellimicrobium roseum]|uniref:Cbb3-type cytochrome c oxidase subunit n=1 Tax=Rubellimicrobium roseum TaxID=687525 RepID=A0A5C4N5I3_9RHOB|nr:cytochrome-c oxidase, cbb3-type subunit III [Rubellimicrobium roseum]TNC64501.1 cytochrome-c oxidase, cbb3-type subunit III [Rubellimicrobium roseum]
MTRNDKTPTVATTGHEWDGIEELNNPLPRWWLWVFYATIVWGVGYTIAYPAWPLVSGATAGLLGYSTRGDVAADIAGVEAGRAGMMEKLAGADLTQLPADPELHAFALDAGASVFRANCAQCHGAGAAGVQAGGFPNLLDDDWLWGGTIEDVAHTVAHGIRNEASGEARWSEMPAFSEILEDGDITAVVNHVLAISGQEHDAALAATGAQVFTDNCSACHAEDGAGMRELGAPNLTDAVWLYGGTPERIEETVRLARFGVMPAWSEEFRPQGGLSQAEINAVAAYVHGLGGGE